VTRACDWRIADLVDGPAPVSLYLVVPPSDISRTKPLIRLILNQVGRRLTEELNPKGRPHRLLLMLDEFPALGRLDFFESALAFMAGYGIKAFLIAQSLNQIEKAYGQNNAILDNCHVRVAFATNDERTAKRISDALGTATEMRAMKNYAGHRLSPWLGHLMVSRTETARPLLTPGEIMQLSDDEEIVMAAGIPPIRADKARYFTDPRFTARLLPPPKVQPLDPKHRPRDDWSNLKPVDAPPMPVAEQPVDKGDTGKDGTGGADEKGTAADDQADTSGDPANAGIRREPELGEHEEIVPPAKDNMAEEMSDDDQQDDEAARARRQAERLVKRNARNASLDPDDGIVL
jgi:type IV secretion system protein VirD4